MHEAALFASIAFAPAPRLTTPSCARRVTRPCLCRSQTTSLPLYDPLGDAVPFPFPRVSPSLASSDDEVEGASPSAYRYAFDRPVYLRMLRELPAADDESDPPLFGHLVLQGEGERPTVALGPAASVRAGSVGVALRVLNIEFGERPAAGVAAAGAAAGESLGEEVATAKVEAAYRFKIDTIESSIPFPVAAVSVLSDTPAAADAEAEATAAAEAEVIAALERLIEVSNRLEAAGDAADEAENALELPAALLHAHERATRARSS